VRVDAHLVRADLHLDVCAECYGGVCVCVWVWCGEILREVKTANSEKHTLSPVGIAQRVLRVLVAKGRRRNGSDHHRQTVPA
jgi:hypothetical protein